MSKIGFRESVRDDVSRDQMVAEYGARDSYLNFMDVHTLILGEPDHSNHALAGSAHS